MVCYICGERINREDNRTVTVEYRMPAAPNCARHDDCENEN